MPVLPQDARAAPSRARHRPVTFTVTAVNMRTGDYTYQSFVVMVRYPLVHTVLRGRHAA